jgi:hypothetical protein
MPLWAAVDLLRQQKLRMTLVDHLRVVFDPFEGSVPDVEIERQGLVIRGSWPTAMQYRPGAPGNNQWEMDGHARLKQIRMAKVRSAYVSCWTFGPESEGMWRLYCNDGTQGRGVSLQTTFGALTKSLEAHDLVVSRITYRYYHDVDPTPFTDELDPFMHKRKGFEHENEVRFLRFDDDHYRALMPDLPALGSLAGNRAVPKPVPPDLPRYFPVDWCPQDALEHVTISPYADEAYETTARDALIWAAGSASFGDKIELSILHPHRHRPKF